MWQVTCSPRPPTLAQRHVDLHVWSYPRRRPSYIFQVPSKSVKGFWSPWGSKFAHSHYFGYWLLQQLGLPCKPWCISHCTYCRILFYIPLCLLYAFSKSVKNTAVHISYTCIFEALNVYNMTIRCRNLASQCDVWFHYSTLHDIT